MYEPGCGLSSLLMSWGHDEYLHQVLRNHPTCTLPPEALYIIRFHSFYPWHTAGDYEFLMDDLDREMYYWVKEFNKFDLYTKDHDLPDMSKLRDYYQGLVDKYIPGPIAF